MPEVIPMKWASWTNFVFGIWLIIAPWVLGYGAFSGKAAAEDVILGIAVLCVAIWSVAVRPGNTSAAWVNVALGIWVIIAPWVLQYSAAPRAVGNDVILGILIVIFALIRASARPQVPVGPMPPRA
jgi:hypothetical protein